MTVPRLYLEAQLIEGARVDLDPDQARYLVQVLRQKPGDEARVFNARDGEWTATIADAGKKRTALTIGAQRRAPSPPRVDLHLLFAPVKRTRTDFIVEKATELGVTAIRPVITHRTNSERVRTDRLTSIAREAAEQSERLDLPEVREAESLDRVLDAWTKTEAERRLLFLDEAAGGDGSPWREVDAGAPAALAALMKARRSQGQSPWAVLIGPEGGFSPEERARLRAAPFVTPASLGPRILRADTAVVAALTLWQAALGDWG